MKIFVLNGSPKGKSSFTLYTIKFLAKKFPEHTFEILNVAQRVRAYQISPSDLKVLEEADLIIFAYPVYTYLVPSQFHKIIQLLKKHDINLKGKWATQITTSKHMYDYTSHRFIEDNCADMGMRIISGLSADMDDILKPKGQEEALKFWDSLLYAMSHSIEIPRSHLAHSPSESSPQVTLLGTSSNSESKEIEKSKEFDTLILADLPKNEGNLFEMIEYFKEVYPNKTRLINIADFKFSGGCIGCLRCTETTMCIHKDGFDTFLRTEILTADTIIYATEIQDHSMGYNFKVFRDRNFCNGHRTTTMGKPMGYIISGKLSHEENLKNFLSISAQVEHNYLSYIANDEFDAAKEIENLALQTDFALRSKILLPQNFYGVSGHKVFRDLIYEMRGMMPEDHKFYKKKGFYKDFPQRKWLKSIFMIVIGKMMKSKKWNSKIQAAIEIPYQKVIDKA